MRSHIYAMLGIGLLIGGAFALIGGCATTVDEGQPLSATRDLHAVPDAVPRGEPLSRRGNASSYVVWGKRYTTLKSAKGYVETGVASWYGARFHGRLTANGEIYDMYQMTAAHRSLPLPTYVSVRNLRNGRSVVVRVNDRGPFHGNRLIDLSLVAATKLGFAEAGTTMVELRAIDPETWSGTLAAVDSAQATGSPEREKFFVQAGAFAGLLDAHNQRARLSAATRVHVKIHRADTDAGGLYKVRVGPFASAEDADRHRRELLVLGFDLPHVPSQPRKYVLEASP